MIQDSGERKEFDSGAVRDIAEGKGRCDLIPLYIIGNLYNDVILCSIGDFVYAGDIEHIKYAIKYFIEKAFSNSPATAILEVAIHYEEGAKKYSERNWEKGIPLHCYIDSGIRHYLKFLRGDDDERHDRAFIWNMIGLLWTFYYKPELNDLPFANKNQ